MRRILEGGRDRWAFQVVLLAFFCASANDVDVRHITSSLPDLEPLPVVAIAALVFMVSAATWVMALFLLSWIATFVGRMLRGVGTVADVRAALAWAIVPVIWSIVYRIPVAVYKSQIEVPAQINVREVLLNFLAHGGCGMIVVVLALQTLFFLWCLLIGSFTLAEAHRFSADKGFVTLVSAIALPLLVIAAAFFTFAK